MRPKHRRTAYPTVGVSNIVGVISDPDDSIGTSPFNIADTLNVPYFTDRETAELLHQLFSVIIICNAVLILPEAASLVLRMTRLDITQR